MSDLSTTAAEIHWVEIFIQRGSNGKQQVNSEQEYSYAVKIQVLSSLVEIVVMIFWERVSELHNMMVDDNSGRYIWRCFDIVHIWLQCVCG